MNSLSWLIYLAHVCGNLGSSLNAFLVITILLTAAFVIYGAFERDSAYRGDERHTNGIATQAKAFRTGIPFVGLWLLLMVVVPSQDTVYAIAASETGEEILNSDTGGKAVKALNAWLDRQINPAPKAVNE